VIAPARPKSRVSLKTNVITSSERFCRKARAL
jgi:hypothetical protein